MTVERASVCPLDCPDTCSLTVTVEDARIVPHLVPLGIGNTDDDGLQDRGVHVQDLLDLC